MNKQPIPDPTRQQRTILGLCNPLLDISAYVDQELLDKYQLKANNVILASEKHANLCQDLVDNYGPVEYTAGGSAQNVMRVAAGILRRQKVNSKVLFTGSIGNDEFGSMMAKKAEEDGVVASYSICQTIPTGTCAVCLTDKGKCRSLCAFLGASEKFSEQHLRDNWLELVENTNIVYISGFLITSTPATFELLGKHVAESEEEEEEEGKRMKRFCLNLSAPYISERFGDEIAKIMKYVDILFGNNDEALAYAKHRNWLTENVSLIAERICKEEKVRKGVGRLVIITQGDGDIIVAEQRQQPSIEETGIVVSIEHYPCETIPACEMVDTNGAGDSFAAGFLSQYLQEAPIDFCVKMGSYAAREIIKMSGIVVPGFDGMPTRDQLSTQEQPD